MRAKLCKYTALAKTDKNPIILELNTNLISILKYQSLLLTHKAIKIS